MQMAVEGIALSLLPVCFCVFELPVLNLIAFQFFGLVFWWRCWLSEACGVPVWVGVRVNFCQGKWECRRSEGRQEKCQGVQKAVLRGCNWWSQRADIADAVGDMHKWMLLDESALPCSFPRGQWAYFHFKTFRIAYAWSFGLNPRRTACRDKGDLSLCLVLCNYWELAQSAL